MVVEMTKQVLGGHSKVDGLRCGKGAHSVVEGPYFERTDDPDETDCYPDYIVEENSSNCWNHGNHLLHFVAEGSNGHVDDILNENPWCCFRYVFA